MKYDFINTSKGKVVIYTEVIGSAAYQSLHFMGSATEAEAKVSFHREHKKEVLELIHQNKTRNENTSKRIMESSFGGFDVQTR